MTAKHLELLLALADIARQSGRIAFEAMPEVSESVLKAKEIHNALKSGYTLVLVAHNPESAPGNVDNAQEVNLPPNASN